MKGYVVFAKLKDWFCTQFLFFAFFIFFLPLIDDIRILRSFFVYKLLTRRVKVTLHECWVLFSSFNRLIFSFFIFLQKTSTYAHNKIPSRLHTLTILSTPPSSSLRFSTSTTQLDQLLLIEEIVVCVFALA